MSNKKFQRPLRPGFGGGSDWSGIIVADGGFADGGGFEGKGGSDELAGGNGGSLGNGARFDGQRGDDVLDSVCGGVGSDASDVALGDGNGLGGGVVEEHSDGDELSVGGLESGGGPIGGHRNSRGQVPPPALAVASAKGAPALAARPVLAARATLAPTPVRAAVPSPTDASRPSGAQIDRWKQMHQAPPFNVQKFTSLDVIINK
ncbi:unnamed protein product, partial [Iphiclides podalirius]